MTLRLSAGPAFDATASHDAAPTIFPDKTSQVWRLPEHLLAALDRAAAAAVRWDFESEAELLHLAQLAVLLKSRGLRVTLELPYLPYARQDKDVDNAATFALHAFAKLLNALELDAVRVLDAHSAKASDLIQKLEDRAPRAEIEGALRATGADLILFPDAGAKARYGAYGLAESIHAEKNRDQGSGLIKGIVIRGAVKGRRLLIVDDICDGGMTFKLVAERALADGAAEVHLFTTHGIFSKGVATLRASGIRRVFTHDGEIPQEAA